jgi:hypothetical protein
MKYKINEIRIITLLLTEPLIRLFIIERSKNVVMFHLLLIWNVPISSPCQT